MTSWHILVELLISAVPGRTRITVPTCVIISEYLFSLYFWNKFVVFLHYFMSFGFCFLISCTCAFIHTFTDAICCCELRQWADGVGWFFYDLKEVYLVCLKSENVYFSLHIFLSYRLAPLVLKMILMYFFPGSSSLSDLNNQYSCWHMAWQIKAEIVNGLSSLMCFITVFHQAFAILIWNV